MKTLSIQQPWASLIVAGIKDVEVRSWDTSHRGKILIHASSKKVTASLYDKIPMELSAEIENAQFYGLLPFDDVLPTSAIIGYVEIADCVQQQVDSLWSGCDSDYNWILKNAYVFDNPIVGVKGKLHLFDYPELDENNLPPAHKVTLRKAHIENGVPIQPCLQNDIDYALENGNKIYMSISQDIIDTYWDENSITQFKQIIFENELGKRQKFNVESIGIVQILNKSGEPIRRPSFYSESLDYMSDFEQMVFTFNK